MSPVQSKVRASALQARKVLADFARVQQNLTDLSSRVKETHARKRGAVPWYKAGPVFQEEPRGVVMQGESRDLRELHVAVLGLKGIGTEVARQVSAPTHPTHSLPHAPTKAPLPHESAL